MSKELMRAVLEKIKEYDPWNVYLTRDERLPYILKLLFLHLTVSIGYTGIG